MSPPNYMPGNGSPLFTIWGFCFVALFAGISAPLIPPQEEVTPLSGLTIHEGQMLNVIRGSIIVTPYGVPGVSLYLVKPSNKARGKQYQHRPILNNRHRTERINILSWRCRWWWCVNVYRVLTSESHGVLTFAGALLKIYDVLLCQWDPFRYRYVNPDWWGCLRVIVYGWFLYFVCRIINSFTVEKSIRSRCFCL